MPSSIIVEGITLKIGKTRSRRRAWSNQYEVWRGDGTSYMRMREAGIEIDIPKRVVLFDKPRPRLSI